MDKRTEQVRDKIISLIEDKQGKDITCLDIRELSNYTDFFIICHTDIEKQSQTIAQYIEKNLKEELKIKPLGIEGMESGKWILMDYIDIICHIFTKESREYYNLEQLWAGGKVLDINLEKTLP